MAGSDSSGPSGPQAKANDPARGAEPRVPVQELLDGIQRHHRRRLLRRLAKAVVLVALVALVVVAVQVLAERQATDEALAQAQQQLLLGTAGDAQVAMQTLQARLVDAPEDPRMTNMLALIRGHVWLEFGEQEQEARFALAGVTAEQPAHAVASAMLVFCDGRVGDAATALASVPTDAEPWVKREALWLRGLVAVAAASSVPSGDTSDASAQVEAAPEPSAELASALDDVANWVSEHDSDIALRRMLAHLQLHAGATDDALATLADVRAASEQHMGLAADDALYNAVLRTKLAGVASVADQLLEPGVVGLSPADRAHAVLARAVVHAQSGERELALKRLDEAWEELEPWNTLDRRLAMETALEAGDATRVGRWAVASGLPPDEIEIYEAWGVLLRGDVMEALRLLAALDQERPRVSYLQALALVEQGRWPEAEAWIQRTEAVLPGRVEIEVARARVELRTGNPETALSKLRALAEFEPYAPRAWTGLGEAHLLQVAPDYPSAKRALQRAVDREPVPAEATLLLARVAGSLGEPVEALALYERAATINPRLPKYGEALALHLAKLGLLRRAQAALRNELDRPGVGAAVPVALVSVLLRSAEPSVAELDSLLDKAQERGAEESELVLRRARVLLLRGAQADVAAAVALTRGHIATAPTDVPARALLVRALLAARDPKAAEAALRRGLQACPDGTKGRLIFEWALMDSRAGRRRVAAPRSRRAWVDMLSEERSAWELLDAAELSIRLWLRSRKERVALTIAGQLTDKLGYHSAAWTLRARTELSAGDTKDARGSAQKAVALDGNNPEAHEAEGNVLLRLGQRDAARKAYDRAIALAAGTPAEAGFRANLSRL